MNRESRFIILAFCLKYHNDWNSVMNAVQKAEDLSDDEYLNAVQSGINFVCILDKEFPERLKKLAQPPFLIYYEGDINLLSKIDENQGKNELVFLYGDNRYNIPADHLVTFDDEYKLDICGSLKIWFDNKSLYSFTMPGKVCQSIACSNRYSLTKGPKTKFAAVLLPYALAGGCDVYMSPTCEASFNNDIINEGAFLLDRLDRIPFLGGQNNG